MALRHPGRTASAIGLCSSVPLIAPALGMQLGMPGARVVDPGHTSRDGYDMVVEPSARRRRRPLYVTVDAADAQR